MGRLRMMLTLILIASGFLVLGGAIAAVRRAHPSRALPPSGRAGAGLFSLRAGDVVQHVGTDYIVDSTITYTEEGLTWQEHLLGGGERDRWLIIEEDDRVLVALVEEVEDVPLGPLASSAFTPEVDVPPATLAYRGGTFRLREQGRATATRKLPGTGREQSVSCSYWDYDGPDDQVLYVERWPGETEASYGRKLSPAALTVLPGS